MKKAGLLLLLLAPLAVFAQQNGSESTSPAGTIATTGNFPIERVETPNAADLYCAGFIGKGLPSREKFVGGGLESPDTTRFHTGDTIFLSGGGYDAGQQFTVVRELHDINRYELFKGQWSALKAAGEPFEEVARVRVIDNRSKMAIAQVEFSCDAVVPGDFVIPFVEKSTIVFHSPIQFDRFAPANNQLTGRILMAKDFDSQLGTGSKVYVNIGASHGLKVGDYLRAVRSYTADAHDPVDSLSFKASATESTQKRQAAIDPNFMTATGGPVVHVANMPRRALAEIVIIGTTPSTATGMIVFAMEPVHLGDKVELDPQQ